MGTDIHFFIEKKMKDSKKWKKVDIPDYLIPDERDYVMFGFLANVRNGSSFLDGQSFSSPLFPYRGWPSDSCYKEGYDWHSHTYFTWKEINEIYDKILISTDPQVKALQDRYFFIFFRYVLDRIFIFPWQIREEDVRILICFDS